ncbi:DUF1127 domain-containing protein [Pararhodobacter sp.]|uniref:DUF1127 domain-containing protein n=1 Tax=Pararhodobacter sp. TaxID=2127056 RepID=UPI002AFF8BF8|nr:DUF1127 domain-containing protein [Pararhodobacter sp.]
MAYASATSHGVSGFFGQIIAAASSLRTAWNRSRVYTQTCRELAALSSHELADIGINRNMISRIAYEAAYGRDDL